MNPFQNRYFLELVEKDAEGYYYVIGRIDSLVKVKGYRINPMEIDNILETSSQVTEAKTITFNEEECGEAIVCFVVLSTPKEEIKAELLELCGNALPSYMKPNSIIEIEQIPTGKSGKYDTHQLKKLYLDNYAK